MSNEPDEIIFPRLPDTTGIPDQMKEFRGYELIKKGDRFVLPLNDPALRRGFPDTLDWHPRIEIDASDAQSIAKKMTKALPADYETYADATMNRPKEPVEILQGYGVTADIRRALIEVLFADRSQLPDAIANILLPLMRDRFAMKFIFPISVRARQTQFTFSLAKIINLIETHGIEKSKTFIDRGFSLPGIEMTGGLQILTFVEALTRVLPISFSHPVNRMGCSWFFYKDGFDIAPPEAMHSAVGQFLSFDNPRNEWSSVHGLQGAINCREEMIWQMHRAAVIGVNQLIGYLSDLRTFMRPDGTVDFVKQLKAFATLRLAFADLNGINAVAESYSRTAHALGFIDKLANLVCGLEGVQSNKTEGEVWERLVSIEFGDFVSEQINTHIGQVHSTFSDAILPAVNRCFSELHEDLGGGRAGQISNSVRAKNLRTIRNLNHGAFLRSGQFESLLTGNSSTVPESIVTLPFSLSWGLIASPKDFIAQAIGRDACVSEDQ